MYLCKFDLNQTAGSEDNARQRSYATRTPMRKPTGSAPKQYEPVHEIFNNVLCATSKASDQPAHTRSLIRAFASRLSILWLYTTDWTSFVVSKLKRRLQMLFRVYICQNATLLETSCHGSLYLPSFRLRGHTIVTLYVACPSIKHAISKERITKALIRLRACACWSAPLCARIQRQVFSRRGYLSKNAVNNCNLIFELSWLSTGKQKKCWTFL